MSKAWKPYENDGAIPFPLIQKSQQVRLDGILRSWYSTRWKIFASLLKKSPGFPLTNGELIILIPALLCILIVSIITLVQDDLESSGNPPTFSMGLCFIFACHNSMFTLVTGIPFERAIRYHKVLAYMALVTGTIHGAIFFHDGNGDDPVAATIFGQDLSPTALTGLLLLIMFFCFILTSLPPIRRHLFDVFYRFHWLLIIAAVVLAFMHGAGAMAFGLVFWLLDVAYRFFYQALQFHSRKATLQRLPADVMRVTFSKHDLRYKAGQYVFICIPAISYLEWHPFSISSSPHHDQVSLHIRALGDWTTNLLKLCSQDSIDIDILMEGPYGEPSIDIDSDMYKCVILVSGGIGITPMQSIYNNLHHQFHRGRPLLKCWFVWSVRDRFMIDAIYDSEKLSKRLPYSFTPDGLDEIDSNTESIFTTEFYLTKARDEELFSKANIHPDIQSCLRFNRPDFNNIFESVKTCARENNERRIAVLVCGPDGMVNAVRRCCAAQSNSDVTFELHSETFAF